MKYNNLNKKKFQIPEANQKSFLEKLNAADNKEEALYEMLAEIAELQYEGIINQILEDSEEAAGNTEYLERMGYRTHFTKAESDFLQQVTSVTFSQGDIIPDEYINRTMDSIKKSSGTPKLWRVTPATVKKWITGKHSSAFVWGKLTDKLTETITGGFESIDLELGKLYLVFVVPKSIRDLALPFVDAYIQAVLQETAHDGLVYGYLHGDGVNGPVGVFRKVSKSNPDGTKEYKTPINLKGFGVSDLKSVKKTLSTTMNGDEKLIGNRIVPDIKIIANPADVYEYIEPALYAFINGAWVTTSRTKIEVIEEPMCSATHVLTAEEKEAAAKAKSDGNILSLYQDSAAAGTAGTTVIPGEALITIGGAYTMGLNGVKIQEYKETKAMDDADLFIGKAYANGRADDDNAAIPFDPTKLEEFIQKVLDISNNA